MSANRDEQDVWWLRWLKFVSVIVVPAGILGVGFLFGPYFLDEQIRRSYRIHNSDLMMSDTMWLMKFRFWLGVTLGGGLGMIYVFKCIIRKVDP